MIEPDCDSSPVVYGANNWREIGGCRTRTANLTCLLVCHEEMLHAGKHTADSHLQASHPL